MASMMSDSDFWMYQWKVTKCELLRPHDWQACTCAHMGETARRRDPSLYKPVPCPDVKNKRECPRGESCPYTHSLFEYWLHPEKFRTCMCEYGTMCTRRICFFAHQRSELRHPTSSTVNDGIKHTESPAAAISAGSSNSNSSAMQRNMLTAGIRTPDQQMSPPMPSAEACVAMDGFFSSGRSASLAPAPGKSPVQHSNPGSGKPATAQLLDALHSKHRQQSCSAFAAAYSQALDALMPQQELAGMLSQQKPKQAAVVESLSSGQLAATSFAQQQQQQEWQQQTQQTSPLSGAWSNSGPPLGSPQQLHGAANGWEADSPALEQRLQQMLLDLWVHEHVPDANTHIVDGSWSSSSNATSPLSGSNAATSVAFTGSLGSYRDLLSVSAVSPILSPPVSALPSPASGLLPGAFGAPAALHSSVAFQPLQDVVHSSSSSNASAGDSLQHALLLQHCLQQQEQQQLQQLLVSSSGPAMVHTSPQAFAQLMARSPASASAAAFAPPQLPGQLPPQPRAKHMMRYSSRQMSADGAAGGATQVPAALGAEPLRLSVDELAVEINRMGLEQRAALLQHPLMQQLSA